MDWGGLGEGYTGYPPSHPSGPIFNIFKAKGPTHGRMKAILEVFMRFLRMGLEWVQNGSRKGPRMTSISTSQTGPEMALRSLISLTSETHGPE